MQPAGYPSYHGKYNPIGRVFGVLENHWNGDPLTRVAKASGMAGGMTCKGVKLDKKSMKPYGKCLHRLADPGKWFISISSVTATEMLPSMTI